MSVTTGPVTTGSETMSSVSNLAAEEEKEYVFPQDDMDRLSFQEILSAAHR